MAKVARAFQGGGPGAGTVPCRVAGLAPGAPGYKVMMLDASRQAGQRPRARVRLGPTAWGKSARAPDYTRGCHRPDGNGR
jgi:hypothetical protein